MQTRSSSVQETSSKQKNKSKSQTKWTGQTGSQNTYGHHSSLSLQRNLGNRGMQRLLDLKVIQAKLKIGSPNDAYEQEADRVAEQVMRMPDHALMGNTFTAPTTKLEIQRQTEDDEEEEFIQPKTTGESSVATPTFGEGMRAIQGAGVPLPQSTLRFFEPRFGTDFNDVRVHSDSHASDLAGQVHAKAFTLGRDLVFASGQYSPESSEGRHLLAHELTHVVQQRQGQVSRTIQRVHTFTPGRPAHDHTPVGWATVQAGLNCSPLSERGRIECVCATLSPINVLNTVLFVEMSGMPRATAHLNHYISGGGADFNEDSNLSDLINQDAAVRGKFAAAIAAAPIGNIPVWQGDYTVQDFRFAFGGIDRVDYEVDAAAGTVDIWFKDRYDFHPAGFGYANKGVGDSAPPGRITNCVHAAAVELKATGSAADFWMQGEATFPLSLFTPSPSPSPGGDDL